MDFPYKIITENLPDFTNAQRLYLDIETRNNTQTLYKDQFGEDRPVLDKKYSGLYPFPVERNGKVYQDDIAGFAFTVDDHPMCCYVPMRHRQGQNCEISTARRWLKDHIGKIPQWINHNVTRFDAPFMSIEGIEFGGELVDTLTLSKVHDTDRMGHDLKTLCRDWCDLPMEEELDIKAYLKSIKSKDYARVPIDILGRYACMDIFGNRKLYEYLLENRKEGVDKIWEVEIKLAAVLFDMQKRGLKVDRRELLIAQAKAMRGMLFAAEEIEELNFGQPFTDSAKCIYDLLHVQRDLPVLVRKPLTEINRKKGHTYGSATYDKAALEVYLMHPDAPTDLIKALLSYRTHETHKTLYVDVMLELMDTNSRIHPQYNAVVRTGRMSASQPNSMQQNKKSKTLIHPDHGFVSCDYSQIEYRLIVHFINDYEAIEAYQENPETDFHQWVADLVGISRVLAKTLNFAMAYGAGKKKVTSQIAKSDDIRNVVGPLIDQLIEEGTLTTAERTSYFVSSCADKAGQLFTKYHERFPGIKITAKVAESICKTRGWVKTPYGRRRHIPARFAYKAFNTVVQGWAAEIMKEAMIKISPRYNPESKKRKIEIAINVHDELVIDCPDFANSDLHTYFQDILENPSCEIKVPLRTGLGFSGENWALANSELNVQESIQNQPMPPALN